MIRPKKSNTSVEFLLGGISGAFKFYFLGWYRPAYYVFRITLIFLCAHTFTTLGESRTPRTIRVYRYARINNTNNSNIPPLARNFYYTYAKNNVFFFRSPIRLRFFTLFYFIFLFAGGVLKILNEKRHSARIY